MRCLSPRGGMDVALFTRYSVVDVGHVAMSTPYDDLAAQAAEVRESARRAVCAAAQLVADVQRARAGTTVIRCLVDLRDMPPPGTASQCCGRPLSAHSRSGLLFPAAPP